MLDALDSNVRGKRDREIDRKKRSFHSHTIDTSKIPDSEAILNDGKILSILKRLFKETLGEIKIAILQWKSIYVTSWKYVENFYLYKYLLTNRTKPVFVRRKIVARIFTRISDVIINDD